MQQKKKRYTLVYSRRIHDNRIYGNNVYKQHFLDILAARCTNEVEDAKSRVIITNEGKYNYILNEEYKNLRKRILRERTLIQQNIAAHRKEGLYNIEDEEHLQTLPFYYKNKKK